MRNVNFYWNQRHKFSCVSFVLELEHMKGEPTFLMGAISRRENAPTLHGRQAVLAKLSDSGDRLFQSVQYNIV